MDASLCKNVWPQSDATVSNVQNSVQTACIVVVHEGPSMRTENMVLDGVCDDVLRLETTPRTCGGA